MRDGRLKRILKRTPLYPALRVWRNRRTRLEWERNGRPIPAPPAVKQVIVRSFATKYHTSVFVETGTLFGDMTEAMRRGKCFTALHSIELDASLAAAAQERFRAHGDVSIHQGDSAALLPTIVASLPPTTAALFWLDGHYSGEGTARGEVETPIRRELMAILTHPCDRHVILIDDARHFLGENDYPTIDEVRAIVGSYRPSARVAVEHDIIRITPC